ncbi:MAG: hypothetical protein WCD80_13480 [Desulfobaccales bacterium]
MATLEIRDYQKIVPDAFHGTLLKNVAEILSEGFRLSRGPSQFLGDGIYFFESSEWHAKNWALRHRERGTDRIAVIQAIINLGHCFDLHNAEYRGLAREIKTNLERKGTKKITDAVVINLLATKFTIIDSVRATYISTEHGRGQRIFEGSRFFEYVQLMICVRKVENITNPFMVYSGYGS